ncbi:MAG: tetratricopeptide repeat protein [Candidatus Acidiferrales bacterium]
MFPLVTYDDVKPHARAIAAVTRSRAMPPWLPEPGYGEFAGDPQLTRAQIQMIAAWVNAGAPEGPAEDIPAPPHFDSEWQLGTPDLVVPAAQAFKVPANGPDVFWNFIFSPPIDKTRYVRAIEIRPGAPHAVHHANIVIDRDRWARLQEKTPGAGFPGMDLVIDRNLQDPDSHFLFWKPGSVPWQEPDGFSWRLDPGNDLVLNAHMMPMGEPKEVKPSIGLYFTDKPPTHFPMIVELEHDGALDIPPGDADFLVSDDFRLPLDVDVLAIYPHAHYLGHLLEAYATLPGGRRVWLIRIPDWNMNWQGVYHFRAPVFLPKGTVVSMRYHYDNSDANPRNPSHPPKRVRAGNQSTDEMGHLWLQVLPRGTGDRRRELEEALVRHRLEKYPGDYSARVMLGALRISRLDPAGAVEILGQAIRMNPQGSEGHYWLGMALQSVGRSQEAVAQFRTALQLNPDYTDARFDLANSLARAGQLDEAADDYRRVLAVFPHDAHAHNSYGEVLLRQNHPAEAIKEFDAALTADSNYTAAQRNRDRAQAEINAP